MKKRKIHLTLYSGLVLAMMAVILLKQWPKDKGPLFNDGSQITLYVETLKGVKPEIRLADFFAGEELDFAKVSFDLNLCDWNTVGKYELPVYYEKKETDCVIQVKVREQEKGTDISGGDGTVITDIP